jgi:hypothetical protein
LRIGLVWSGNPRQGNDHNRSMPLATLLPLLDLNARFVSLQKDPRPDDKAVLNGRTDILDVSDALTDFVETASLVSCLDLVITVRTSVAHLSATMARPTWVMLPYVADWRWPDNRDDSPWYPTNTRFCRCRHAHSCRTGSAAVSQLTAAALRKRREVQSDEAGRPERPQRHRREFSRVSPNIKRAGAKRCAQI